MEDWLPPAKRTGARNCSGLRTQSRSHYRQPLGENRIDDGRINFKKTDIKQPFALISVRGSVEQISPGRWKLALEAQPWRSGVVLQSAGSVQVRGDIAGTSARLQPASFAVRWNKVSLADLFRLLHGKDYGVRGTFELEATAKSGAPPDTTDSANIDSSSDFFVGGDWSYSLRASAAQIHRWDLTERSDNPALTANVQGRCNVALKKLVAETLSSRRRYRIYRARRNFSVQRIRSCRLNSNPPACRPRTFSPGTVHFTRMWQTQSSPTNFSPAACNCRLGPLNFKK